MAGTPAFIARGQEGVQELPAMLLRLQFSGKTHDDALRNRTTNHFRNEHARFARPGSARDDHFLFCHSDGFEPALAG